VAKEIQLKAILALGSNGCYSSIKINPIMPRIYGILFPWYILGFCFIKGSIEAVYFQKDFSKRRRIMESN
jgi:hypothetical protein